jgi:hypothetical protein
MSLPPVSLFICLNKKNLATAVHAAIGAGMVRETRLPAIRAGHQLWQVQMMMRSALSLACARDALFW